MTCEASNQALTMPAKRKKHRLPSPYIMFSSNIQQLLLGKNLTAFTEFILTCLSQALLTHFSATFHSTPDANPTSYSSDHVTVTSFSQWLVSLACVHPIVSPALFRVCIHEFFPHFFLAYFSPLLSIYTIIVSTYPLFFSYSLLSLLFPPPSIIICLVRNSLSFSLGFFVTR